MELKSHTEPHKLDMYAFWWSEARLAIAALALLMGGVPPVLALNPMPSLYGIVGSLLSLCWIISGAAAVWLAYRWYTSGQRVFGGTDRKDVGAFAVMVVSGFNLGFAGLMGANIGMSISSNYTVFLVVAALYVVSGGYLYKRWSAHGKKLF